MPFRGIFQGRREAAEGYLTAIGNPGMLESMIYISERKIRVKINHPKWRKEFPGQEKTG